ncbi:hypothetical protein F4780DRAFT_777616 [Xylariomycetidae sp. FL0641]|nr:hypothetical protein F4780DRAFT_777616 [Xylariomycetidae sp. FL0641]
MPDWTCGTCWRTFTSWGARQQHMDALYHEEPMYECDSCARYFVSPQAKMQHMYALNHHEYECDFYHCDETFPDEEELREHEIDDHFYCDDCDRVFQSLNNIKMHLNSRIHRGQDVVCPFCKNGFTSATGLSHHLETGSCKVAPFLDRDTVYKIVRMKDPGGLITKNLLTGSGPISTKYEATIRAWNGSAYECYLCSRGFRSLESLNQHLSSPKHQQALYRCPNRSSCGREFKTLAAFMNHLESESCGYTRFEAVQRAAKDLVSFDRRLTFR